MSRHGPDSERITLARLDGTATRHARDPEVDTSAAVEELQQIATEHQRGYGPRLRVDLLSKAAGSLIGSYRHNASAGWSAPRAARLLLLAGADEELAKRHADETAAALARSAGRGGIGNPV
jgi:hypothetical protein